VLLVIVRVAIAAVVLWHLRSYFYVVGCFNGKVEHVERLRPKAASQKLATMTLTMNPDRYDWVLVTRAGGVYRYDTDERILVRTGEQVDND
jgi:hypothetical protein